MEIRRPRIGYYLSRFPVGSILCFPLGHSKISCSQLPLWNGVHCTNRNFPEFYLHGLLSFGEDRLCFFIFCKVLAEFMDGAGEQPSMNVKKSISRLSSPVKIRCCCLYDNRYTIFCTWQGSHFWWFYVIALFGTQSCFLPLPVWALERISSAISIIISFIVSVFIRTEFSLLQPEMESVFLLLDSGWLLHWLY